MDFGWKWKFKLQEETRHLQQVENKNSLLSFNGMYVYF